MGGSHPGSTYSAGRGCAAKLTSTATGETLWFSPSFGTTSPELRGPAPSLVSTGTVLAISDAPRIVPPAWGGTPPPTATDAASAQYLAYKNTSGWDLYNHADDIYLFLSPQPHAPGLAAVRRDFFALAGGVPLLPSWAFGLWFTWYHPYTQAEKTAEMTRFIGDDLGLDVASLDRNWRLYGGTSGAGPQEGLYTENTTLLPDLDGFFKWVHNHSLHVFFNDHPKPISYGNQSHPPKQGDPGYPIPLDEMPLGVKETAFRWEGLSSLMDRGLDYWWYDCHWAWSAPSIGAPGSHTSIDGTTWGQAVLDYAQTRYIKSGSNGTATRPGDPSNGESDDVTSFQMGCTGSTHPTSHRYGVHWTGDNFDNHLLTAVSRTIMGGIDGFKPYVHADCTAHHGHDEPEIYIRWIQFCSLSNVFRVHSDPWNDRRPWSFENQTGNETGPPHIANPESTEGIFRNFSKSRLQLNPMYTSAAIQASIDGTPLVQRLDFAYPTAMPGAALLDQYLLLGDGMLFAPVNPFVNKTKDWVDPKVPGTFNRSRTVWIPPATSWEDAFTGEVVSGAATTGTTVLRSEVPLAHTILYHKRPSLAVTARHAARNAATTDQSALVIEAYTSAHHGGDATEEEGITLTSRDLFVSPNEPPLRIELTEHSTDSVAAQAACGGHDSSRHRLISVHVPASALSETNGGAQGDRSWLVRLHLGRGESLLSHTAATAAALNRQYTHNTAAAETAATMVEIPALALGSKAYATPFGGEGRGPPAGSGPVVEVEMGGGAMAMGVIEVCVQQAVAAAPGRD